MFVSTRPEKMMFALLRAAMWQQPLTASCFQEAGLEDWIEMEALSARHGVRNLVLDGCAYLPDGVQPPRQLKLSMSFHLRQRETDYHIRKKSLDELVDYYAQHDVKTMVMKGFGLSLLYPHPSHRECGDADIWLFGKYAQGNDLMRQLGISVNEEAYKHAVFDYHYIHVENHQCFLNERQGDVYTNQQDCLEKIMSEQPCEKVSLGETDVFLPPADFNAVFLAAHLMTHFVMEGVSWRHLCDWVAFWKSKSSEVDKEKLLALWKFLPVWPFMQIVNQMAVELFGLPAACFADGFLPAASSAEKSTLPFQRVYDDIMAFRSLPEARHKIGILLNKCSRLNATRWRYKFVIGGGFGQRIWQSVIFHIKHPGKIF